MSNPAPKEAVRLGDGTIVTTVNELCAKVEPIGDGGPQLVTQIRRMEADGHGLGNIFDRLQAAARAAAESAQ
ncbi:MAG: hypothetical protein AAFW97_14700 [Pseudomonadota bacterium]